MVFWCKTTNFPTIVYCISFWLFMALLLLFLMEKSCLFSDMYRILFYFFNGKIDIFEFLRSTKWQYWFLGYRAKKRQISWLTRCSQFKIVICYTLRPILHSLSYHCIESLIAYSFLCMIIDWVRSLVDHHVVNRASGGWCWSEKPEQT